MELAKRDILPGHAFAILVSSVTIARVWTRHVPTTAVGMEFAQNRHVLAILVGLARSVIYRPTTAQAVALDTALA